MEIKRTYFHYINTPDCKSFTDIVLSDVSVTVRSQDPLYNKIGNDVTIKFEVRSGQSSYNNTKIRFETAKIDDKGNHRGFALLVTVEFKNDDPVIKTNLDAQFGDRVEAQFSEATLSVTIKESLDDDYNRLYQCKASLGLFDEQFKSMKLYQAGEKKKTCIYLCFIC